MKRIVFFFLTAISLFALEWHKDFGEAYKTAKKEQKPLFLFIERSDPPCHWCENMKKRTLANPRIASFIQTNFILAKVDKYSDCYPAKLRPRYVPTIYIIDPQKDKVIKTIVGFWQPKEFQSDLDDVTRLLTK